MTEEAVPLPEGEDIDDPGPPHRGISGRRGGCLIALVGAVVLGGGSIGLSYWLLNLRNRPVLEASSELAGIMHDAEKAPGVEVLSQLGCDHAGVFELPALRTIAQRLEDGRAKKEKRAPKTVDVGDERSVVACTMNRQQTPTCEEVAHAYAGAVKRDASFTTWIVNLNGDVCSEEYKADGTRVGPAKKPNLPPLGD